MKTKMAKKNKSKSSKGRSISKLKRNNQKRNKLIKKGKLKPPKSTSTWVKAQQEKFQKKKPQKHKGTLCSMCALVFFTFHQVTRSVLVFI